MSIPEEGLLPRDAEVAPTFAGGPVPGDRLARAPIESRDPGTGRRPTQFGGRAVDARRIDRVKVCRGAGPIARPQRSAGGHGSTAGPSTDGREALDREPAGVGKPPRSWPGWP